MNDVSFIISIDSSFEMTTNFFEHLIKDVFAMQSEIIVVEDAIRNIDTLNYLSALSTKYSNIKIITTNKKLGYGKANNLGVKNCTGKYLYFINTDVFPTENCFEKMLYILQNTDVACVQPLLIWPQNKRIQCAGSFFGEYYKNHLFAGRKLTSIDFSKIPVERQALTSALYAMRKKDFFQYGMFDEFYYNKLESFELSLKLTLHNKKCICIPDAIAYHSQGTGRNQYYFDFYQQEAYFWTNMGAKITPDINNYYTLQISDDMKEQIYCAVAITQTRNAEHVIKDTGLKTCCYSEINGINPDKINLYEILPYSMHYIDSPILFFVENITNLLKNAEWFEKRNHKDVAMDTYGNLLYVDMI